MMLELGAAAQITLGLLSFNGSERPKFDTLVRDKSNPTTLGVVVSEADTAIISSPERFLIVAEKPADEKDKTEKKVPREIPNTQPLTKDSDIQEHGELTNNYTLAPGRSQTLLVGTVGAKAVSMVIVGNDGKRTELKQGGSGTLKATDGGSFTFTYVDKLHVKVNSNSVEAFTATLLVGAKANAVVLSQYIDPATLIVALDKAPKGVAIVGGRDRSAAFGIFTLKGTEKGERRHVTVDCPTGEWTVTAEDYVDKIPKSITMTNQNFYTLHALDGTVVLGGFNARERQFTFQSKDKDVPPFKIAYEIVDKKINVTVKWLNGKELGLKAKPVADKVDPKKDDKK